MENKDPEFFKKRLREAIEEGPAKQVQIADYCDVTVQSVGGWKRSGQISTDNLKKLSEITGYRYLWLKNGTEPKLITDREKNAEEMRIAEENGPYGRSKDLWQSDAMNRLMKSLTYAIANNRISESSIHHLADFIGSLAKNKD